MSYSHMVRAEAKLKAQIDALLQRAKQADEADKNESELDIPAEIARREARLAAIGEARQRLERRQREAELERGRDPDDKPRGGRYKREFGVPEDKAQDNFTDPDSRIMKRAGGGFDASYNAQTAVDDAAQIIVAAELTNCASDAGELPTMLRAVQDNLGSLPEQALADTGYKSEAVLEALTASGCDLVVSLGREGKQALRFHPERSHSGDGGQAAARRSARGLPAPQVDRRAAQRLDQERARVPSVQPEGAAPRPGRVEARLHGAEPAANGLHAGSVKRKGASNLPSQQRHDGVSGCHQLDHHA